MEECISIHRDILSRRPSMQLTFLWKSGRVFLNKLFMFMLLNLMVFFFLIIRIVMNISECKKFVIIMNAFSS